MTMTSCNHSDEMVMIRCINCDKEIYILKDYTKNGLFCTIKCLEEYKKRDGDNDFR